MRQFNTLTGFLLSKSSTLSFGDLVDIKGYGETGDGGGAKWKHNGVTGQAVSQSPTNLNANLLNDGNGNQWALIKGQALNFSGEQWYPLPFGSSGNGAYIFDGNGWGYSNLINDLSQAYTFKTVALMKASNIVFPTGKKLSWQGYYTESDGGSNWGIVSSGAHTDDGGSVFTLADGKYVSANLSSKKINVKKFGAKGDGVTNDAIASQSAIDYGSSTVFFPSAVYLFTLDNTHPIDQDYGISLSKSVKLIGEKDSRIKTMSTSGSILLLEQNVSGIEIDSLEFEGNGSNMSQDGSLSFGIHTVNDPSTLTRVFNDITINKCKFIGGFNLDIDIRNASVIRVTNNHHFGSLFSRFDQNVALAGYQTHLASVNDVIHTGNFHISGGFDRHGLYLASSYSGVNSNVVSSLNIYEWAQTDYLFNPFMAAINIRPGDNISITNEIIRNPRGGGITSITENGKSVNGLVIANNIISGVTTQQPTESSLTIDSAAGISLRASGGGGSTYAFSSVTGNVVTTANSVDNSLVVGASLSGNTVDFSGNVITTFGSNQHSLRFQLASSNISVNNNKFRAANGASLLTNHILLDGATALVDCSIGVNEYSGNTGSAITSNGAFTCNNTLISAPINIYVTSDGAGAVNVSEPFGIVDTVTSNSAGFGISFNALLKPDTCAMQMSARINSIYSMHCDGPSSVTANYSIRDSGNVAMPAATNVERVDIQLNKYV